jgi:diaminopimelate epimerase
MMVYERFEGITLACGTGACAVGLIGYLLKKTGTNVLIKMEGGNLEVQIN